MRELEILREISRSPRAQLDRVLASGKKAVGVMPYFCPEELVYAAGMIPFGLWGADREVTESKRYYPAFICSILHTALSLGIRGELDGLSAVLIPFSCDSLKSMPANWRSAVPSIPAIAVAYAQNRRTEAGIEFTRSMFRGVAAQLEEIAGVTITDAAIADAAAVYNENRSAILAFSDAAARHADKVDAAARSAAIKAGYFMDRAEHTALLRRITDELNAMPECKKGIHVITTGILADSPALLDILTENGIVIAADQIAYESVPCRTLTPVTADPVRGMAERLAAVEGCSVMYDPKKQRAHELVSLVRESGADAVIWFMTRFCDPEEFDYVPTAKLLREEGIPLLTIDTDRQTVNYEKARSAVEAFAESL